MPYADIRASEGVEARHGDNLKYRVEFVGKLAPEDVRKRYIGTSVREHLTSGAQNPCKYVNC